MPKPENRRRPGRPRLAKHEAKGKIVPVRFTSAEIERIAAAAARKGQTVSQWIREMLNAAVEG